MSIELTTVRLSLFPLSSVLKRFNNSRDTDGAVHPPGLSNFSLAASLNLKLSYRQLKVLAQTIMTYRTNKFQNFLPADVDPP